MWPVSVIPGVVIAACSAADILSLPQSVLVICACANCFNSFNI